MSSLEKKLLMSRIPSLPPSGAPGHKPLGGARKGPGMRKRDYTPLPWSQYFDNKREVEVNGGTFSVYERGSEGPVLLLLHGGGYSALTWALFSSVVTREVSCRCVAVDLRGHGDTSTASDDDLSAETMAQDVGAVVSALYPEQQPPIILMGHSMGGAVAVHAAARGCVPGLAAMVVIDVVEGSALDALNSMQSVLRGRPTVFNGLEHAIEWSVRSGQTRNTESARVSMVGQVRRLRTEEEAGPGAEGASPPGAGASDTIAEEDEEKPAADKKEDGTQGSSEQYVWRVDLAQTEKYWRGWFEGLSSMFLSCSVPKLLLLAGVDRLDKTLTVGQMQGKFQMQVLPQVGHAVHEDEPDKVADVIATFLVRHKLTTPLAGFNRTFPAC